MKKTIATVGSLCTDHPAPFARLAPEGLYLYDAAMRRRLLPTETPPAHGAKVYAREPVAALAGTAFVGAPRYGGGACYSARAVRAYASACGYDVDVTMLCSESSPPVAGALEDVRVISAKRMDARHAVIAEIAGDRVIARDRVEASNEPLTDLQHACVYAAVRHANAVMLNAPRDGIVADGAFALAPKATRYFLPTGSLPFFTTARLLRQSHAACCNFAELAAFALAAGLIPTAPCDERQPGAAAQAARLLDLLRAQHLAPSECAVVTLGSHGAVIRDWRRDNAVHLELSTLPRRQVRTREGAGDTFAGVWMLERELGADRPNRELAAAQAATRATARWLGLESEDYVIFASDVLAGKAGRVAVAA